MARLYRSLAARERIIVSYLKMTERELMGERVRGNGAREIEKNGEMRRARLMEAGGENELVRCWRASGGSDSCYID